MIKYSLFIKKKKKINLRDAGITMLPKPVLSAANYYNRRSILAGSSNQTKYFWLLGGYSEQWSYLWRVMGFWYLNPPKLDPNTYFCKKTKMYNFFLQKKWRLNTSPETTNWEYIKEVNTLIKYKNKPNGGYNITHFSTTKDRVLSIHPGKGGEFGGSQRRSYEALMSWWHFLFSTIIETATLDRHLHFFLEKKFNLKQQIFLNIMSVNTTFIKFFFLLKNHIQKWPTNDVYILVTHNFRKFNLIYKKKRYMKKFKRKYILPNDRTQRKALLVKTLANAG